MVLHRHMFFLILFALIIVPAVAYRVIWLATAKKVQGVFYMEGHGNALEQVRSSYSYIWFKHGKDTVWFEGLGNMNYKEGEKVPVLYHEDHPSAARVDNFLSVWGATTIYGGIPVVVLLLLFLHPHIIPYDARLRLCRQKPYILQLTLQ
jgi:hypothetical protein